MLLTKRQLTRIDIKRNKTRLYLAKRDPAIQDAKKAILRGSRLASQRGLANQVANNILPLIAAAVRLAERRIAGQPGGFDDKEGE